MLAAPTNFEAYITEFGISYSKIQGDSKEILESEQGRKWLSSGNAKQFMKMVDTISHDMRHELNHDIAKACENADAIISHSLTLNRALIMSERYGIPLMVGYLFPVFPSTREFAQLYVTPKNIPFLNKLTHRLFSRIYEKGKYPDYSEWRSELGLPIDKGGILKKLIALKIPILHAYSPSLVPKPKDWSAQNINTGDWRISDSRKKLDVPTRTNAELEKWLDEGEAPIYFGFGSLPVLDPEGMIKMALEIAQELKCRAIIGAGWSGMDAIKKELPEYAYLVHLVDHEWLFPRCRSIVHHGGAGTTHTSLRAGVPIVICSTFADQPFWGEKVTKMGVGRYIPFKELTKNKLKELLKRIDDDKVKNRAATLGSKMRQEDGVDTAVQAIDQYLTTASHQ
jgi:sterol 3beta-glucosyltransferase